MYPDGDPKKFSKVSITQKHPQYFLVTAPLFYGSLGGLFLAIHNSFIYIFNTLLKNGFMCVASRICRPQ
jgi:hypothetical protein